MNQTQQPAWKIRPITPNDDQIIAEIIRQVSSEYGLTASEGYSVCDPTLTQLSTVYDHPHSCYWVISDEENLVGGGGIAPLIGCEPTANICELQKMYLLPEIRGQGLARKLSLKALAFARDVGYEACYLETTARLYEAITLYQSLGFATIANHMGNTGHHACELPMLKKL